MHIQNFVRKHSNQNISQYKGAQDELRPISCTGRDSQGGIALTLLDSLDTFLVRCSIV